MVTAWYGNHLTSNCLERLYIIPDDRPDGEDCAKAKRNRKRSILCDSFQFQPMKFTVKTEQKERLFWMNLQIEEDGTEKDNYVSRREGEAQPNLHLKWNWISCRDHPFDNSGRTGSNFHLIR